MLTGTAAELAPLLMQVGGNVGAYVAPCVWWCGGGRA